MENFTESTQAAPVVNAPSAEEAHRGKATTAMVLSIIGLALLILPGLNIAGLVLSIVGLSMAVKNRKAAAQGGFAECSNNSAAFVCGLIGVIVNGAMTLLVVLAFCLFLVLGITTLSVFGPEIGDAITENLPAVQDAIESTLPTVESMITGFVGLL